MKQFLPYSNRVSIFLKRFFLIPIFLLGFLSVNGQNALVGLGFSSGWGGGSCPTGSGNFKYLAGNTGGTYGVTSTANGTGDQYFRFGVDWGGTTAQLAITHGSDVVVVPNTTYSLNTSCTTAGAMKYNVPSTSYNYLFKTLNAGTNPTGTFVFFEVQGTVRSVATVAQSPLAANVTECHKTTVTATLDGALATGQAVYLRYSKDGYSNSSVVKLTGSGTTYTASIPSSFNTAGANVSYYIFTSGDSNVALNGSNADLYTINLNNNGGSNYSYSVAAGGATTYVPDNNFEQALIDLGLDCTLDDYVFTSNISDVTLLDIRDKSIASLVGIKAFINLQKLYCNNEIVGDGNDNAITNLDVSNMTQLRYFYCQNNQITDLNIGGLSNLEALDTSNNPFINTTLDVHLFPNLYYLVCQNNGLTDLNISGLTNLETLITWNNALTAINVSANPKIKYLDCDDNLFTSLDVSALTSLQQFYCSGNLLSSIDVRGLTNLTNFECIYNSSLTCILVDNVADAILKTTTVDSDPLAEGAFFWYKDPTAEYSYCNCSLTTTWNGSSWDHGAPTTGTYAAIIAGNYNESATINACSLTVNSNAIVSIPSGFNVTLNAPIVVESGSSFTLSNNANLVQTNKKSINSGTINVKCSSNVLKRLDYTMWSSPVTGSQTLGNFSPLTSQTPTSRFYIYDNTQGATGLYSSVAPTTPFATGKGYLIRMPNEDPANLGTGSTYYLGTSALTYSGVFTGLPNNGDVTLPVTNATYNAVGNPYPSTIGAQLFLDGNSTDGVLYFWRKTNAASGSAYATFTSGGATTTTPSSVAPDGTIAVGQGFIVKTGVAATTLNFTNAMRTANNSAQFFKTKNVVEKDRVWLNLTNETGVFSQALVAYIADATSGLDIYDGKYINDSPIALTSNINNEEYTIQGRPAFDTSDVVSLNFKTDVAGDYTIAIDHADGLLATAQEVYLVDSKTGTETNLKTSAYTFAAASGVDNARFSLKYQKTLKVDAPVFNENSVTVYKSKGIIYVNSGAGNIAIVKVFDVQGRLIAERTNVKANATTISNLKATQQVLIVKVTGQNNSVVSKKVVY